MDASSSATPAASAPLRIAALLGLLGVALGAFGAHALKHTLSIHETVEVWRTAVLYQLVHATALLAIATAGRANVLLTGLWTAGIVLFSGSLYILALTGIKWLGAITPLGGLAFLAGWLVLVIRGR
jgi:uncharacterized membrane protein YgdD (TMEM256/DUF423 family)